MTPSAHVRPNDLFRSDTPAQDGDQQQQQQPAETDTDDQQQQHDNCSADTQQPLDMCASFRQLAQDALAHGSPSAAAFYADKVVTLTGAQEDVLLLAQAYAGDGAYTAVVLSIL